MPGNKTQSGSEKSSIQTTLLDFVADACDGDLNGNQQFQIVKKRKVSDSPEQNTSKTPPSNSKKQNVKPVHTKNRFTPLLSIQDTNKSESSQSTSSQENSSKQTVKESPPPPIFIKDVINFTTMLQCISSHVKSENFTTKALANRSVKVSVSNVAEYRKLVSYLRESKTCFYTYQLKSEKPFKVVIRNLHYSVDPKEITEALAAEGHTVRNIVNIRHWKTKIPLSMFFVDLEPNTNNASIYKLKTLLHMRIVVESPKPKHAEVQCKRCQQFGHTHAYCTLPHSCVRCGGDHDNRSCSKPTDAKPKCVNCNGDHPANYRGCPEFIKRSKLLSRRFAHQPTEALPSLQHSSSNAIGLTRGTFADVAASQPLPSSIQQTTSSRIETLLETLLSQQEEARKQTNKLIELITTLITKLVK